MSRDIKKEFEEWQELSEEAKSIRPGVTWVGQPKYSIEEMYALRAMKGKDPSCDFSIIEGARRSDIPVGADGQPIPSSGEGKMPTTEEDWDLWYKLNEGVQTSSPIGLLVEKEKATISEGYLVTRLAELEQGIAETAAKLGVTFDPTTGEVQIDPTFEPTAGENVATEIEELAADLGMKKAPAPVAKIAPQKVSTTKAAELDQDEEIAIGVNRTEIDTRDPEIEIEEDDMPLVTSTTRSTVVRPQTRDVEDDFGEIGTGSAEEDATASGNQDPSQGREEKQPEREGPHSVRDLANEVMRRPALLREINAMKEELLDRDVKAKKVLAARRDLEVAKDAMDMDAAIYASQKYKMQMEIATMKIAMLRAIEQGRPHEVDGLKRGIADVYARMSKLENDFAIRAQGHQVDLGGAITNLEDAQKTVELDRKNSQVKHRELFYSNEGLLNGIGIDGSVNDRRVAEFELFDERGVMIDNVADVLSRSTSYNIEGMVVIRKTSVEQDNDTSDAYYIGGSTMPVLDVTTDGGDVEISEEVVANRGIQHGHALDNQEKPDTYQNLGLMRKARPSMTQAFVVSGCEMIKNVTQLAAITPEMLQLLSEMPPLSQDNRRKLDLTRNNLHDNVAGINLDDWLSGVGRDAEKLLERIFLDKDKEYELAMQEDPTLANIGEIQYTGTNSEDNN
ncbi:MAG: hypothetical protein IKJ32_01385 [Clostridia bacterium]|nr:hypothetical protein [Clostridia bacterium]